MKDSELKEKMTNIICKILRNSRDLVKVFSKLILREKMNLKRKELSEKIKRIYSEDINEFEDFAATIEMELRSSYDLECFAESKLYDKIKDFQRSCKLPFLKGKSLSVSDPDFEIKQFIVHQLEQKIDELDTIDFKYCLKDKDKIARTISAFCNRYILTKEQSFIVFGIKDRKSMPSNFSIKDRIIPLEDMLNESRIQDWEKFQFAINKLSEIHLSPCPDPCYTVKSLKLKGYSSITEDTEIIIIHIKSFNLDRPVVFKKKIYIRKNGQDVQATADEIIQLTKRIEKGL